MPTVSLSLRCCISAVHVQGASPPASLAELCFSFRMAFSNEMPPSFSYDGKKTKEIIVMSDGGGGALHVCV